ncbi:carbohydrate ABC transporter permease [Yeguia hominis]|uniref:Sugar ABC transporter permease n=1 Tax=Yeguia hominis TaxID=2763662 RepID=A0A926D9G8_9FIRM|nr:sugar ABC transporter permease [Yeguia hominis]MBC8534151.1 sugar ABC transporter permease [Yeguia hominis]
MLQSKQKRRLLNQLVMFSFLFPAVAIFVFVLLIPFIQGVGIAFTDWNGINPTYNFIGLNNIKYLLNDKQAGNAILNTLYYTVLTCVGVNILALVLTVALNSNVFGHKFLQSVMFLPMITSLVIAAFMWLRIFSDVFPVNFGVASPLTATSTVMPGIALICLWRDTGLAMVIYNAGLQSVPEELREAAKIDGANAWQTFWKITFPMLAPAFTTCITLWLGYGLKAFEYPRVATNGGPGKASETVALFVYNHFFSNNRAGYGQMASIIMLIIVVVITGITTKLLRKREVQL